MEDAHHLSSKMTGFFLYFFYPLIAAEVIYMPFQVDPFNLYLVIVPIGVIAFLFFWLRKVRIILYDDRSLYVRNMLKVEKISMGEVAAVNTPDGRWGDTIYDIELKSGRLIEFIPDFQPPSLFWGERDMPNNVRRFQNRLKTFETR